MAAILLVFPSTHETFVSNEIQAFYLPYLHFAPPPLHGRNDKKKSLFFAVALAFGLWLYMFALTAVAAGALREIACVEVVCLLLESLKGTFYGICSLLQ